MDSKVISQQTPLHWLREITKAKLSQAKLGQVESIGAIVKKWERRGRKNKKRGKNLSGYCGGETSD